MSKKYVLIDNDEPTKKKKQKKFSRRKLENIKDSYFTALQIVSLTKL